MIYGLIIAGLVILGLIGVLLFYLLLLRRIVPTDEVHIVQRGNSTTSYGVGKDSNVYYELPVWLPIWGVSVRELPVSNFDVHLENYEAYDQEKVPFVVDVVSFFHISDSNVAAKKVSSFQELEAQLKTIVQGAIRSILANAPIEKIMEDRSTFGLQFTEAVRDDLANWGVATTKNIELMDIRDTRESSAVAQIQAKRMSAIESESRQEVAKNNQEAEQAELEAKKAVSVKDAQTKREAGEANAKSHQAIGIANALATEKAGIANQEAIQRIATSEKTTTEEQMAVIKVREVKQAEIDKEKEIVIANLRKEQIQIQADANQYDIETAAKADKFKIETAAAAQLENDNLEAKGSKAIGLAAAEVVLADGTSRAESKKLEQLASVTAEVTLADKVGKNLEYQNFLIRKQEVAVTEVVGVAEADAKGRALESADLKVLVNSGNVETGMNSFLDILSSKGGSQMNGALEALEQTPLGGKLVSFLKTLPDPAPASKKKG